MMPKNQNTKGGELFIVDKKYRGALLCDGVGLGKTYIGLMELECIIFERKRVELFVPKAVQTNVWETRLNQLSPNATGLFGNLHVFNQTDLLRSGPFEKFMDEIRDAEEIGIFSKYRLITLEGYNGK